MFRDRNTPAANKGFEKIEPALLLASRMILYSPRAYAIFIRRRIVGSEDEWLDPESELKLPDDEVISSIKRAIPDLDFPPDLFKMAAFAVSKFHPARKSDVISIDYDMIRLLTKNGPSDSQRVAGLFFFGSPNCARIGLYLGVPIHETRSRAAFGEPIPNTAGSYMPRSGYRMGVESLWRTSLPCMRPRR